MGGDRKALIVLAIIVGLAGLVLVVALVVSDRFDRSADDVGECALCRIGASSLAG